MATDDTVVVMQPSGQHAQVPRADCTPTTLPPALASHPAT